MITFFLLPGFLIFGGGKTEDSGQGILVDAEGIAASGADVVAYHDLVQGEAAVMGSAENSVQWQGATWLFSSSENARKFEENPQRYAPQYGGYCAYAMADGKTVKINPDSWSIRDGKLEVMDPSDNTQLSRQREAPRQSPRCVSSRYTFFPDQRHNASQGKMPQRSTQQTFEET